MRADCRLFETVLLQVDQGLLDESAIEQLGFGGFGDGMLAIPGVACLWPRLSQGHGRVGPLVAAWVENGTPEGERVQCPVDIDSPREKFTTADIDG